MPLLGAYVFPHPPIIIPEIGKGEESRAKATIDGVLELSKNIARHKPATIIIITPHGPVFQDAVCVSALRELYGDLTKFGGNGLKFKFENNNRLVDRITASANLDGILVGEIDKDFANKFGISTDIDHGALVPLYFVNRFYDNYKLVHITMGLLPFEDLFKFGICINNAIEASEEDVVVIASGDLSHRLTADAPAGYNPKGKEFDEKLIQLIKENDIESIISIDHSLIESAGECGFRPIIILQGILDTYNIKPHILSYEGPFGVGYSTMNFEIFEKRQSNTFNKLINNKKKKLLKIRSQEDEYITLARLSLEKYIRDGVIIDKKHSLSKELLKNKAGVFVSIKKNGDLRGCIGTIHPTKDSIAEEIIANAISAGTRDPRFNPIEEDELDELVYNVDILKEPEPISSKEQLDVRKYGVIVKKGSRVGLLLPNLDGVDTIDQQISIALNKAGIGEDEKYMMERFEVIRHGAK